MSYQGSYVEISKKYRKFDANSFKLSKVKLYNRNMGSSWIRQMGPEWLDINIDKIKVQAEKNNSLILAAKLFSRKKSKQTYHLLGAHITTDMKINFDNLTKQIMSMHSSSKYKSGLGLVNKLMLEDPLTQSVKLSPFILSPLYRREEEDSIVSDGNEALIFSQLPDVEKKEYNRLGMD